LISDVDPDIQERNQRLLQGLSYLIEWAKHIITLGAALMVLSLTFVKDLAQDSQPPISYIVVISLVAFYLSMLAAVWHALRLIRYAARIVFAAELGAGDDLNILQRHLRFTQGMFLASLSLFSMVALSVLIAWAFGVTIAAPRPQATTTDYSMQNGCHMLVVRLAPPNSSQKLTRPGAGPPAEPARQHTSVGGVTSVADRQSWLRNSSAATAAPRRLRHVGPGRAA
jgi:hypothetical protein